MKIIIVGGGASGLMLASLLAKKDKKLDVTILERSEHVGKKILVTGNGKCNLTNVNLNEGCYNSKQGYEIASSFDTQKYFNELGLLTYQDEEGRVYPLSNSANSVLDILRTSSSCFKTLNNFNVIRILKKGAIYQIVNDKKESIEADIVILAMGGKTYYKENNGYLIASMLSMRVTPLRPTLIGLKVNENLASISNLRCKVKAKLYASNQCVYEDKGEVLFKNDGLSGIVMFQLSSYMARYPFAHFKVTLDLLPQMKEEDIRNYIEKYPSMLGMFPKMINQFILKRAQSNDPLKIARIIKNVTFDVLDTYDFKNAQVTSGGVNLLDLTNSLECKASLNCFVIGEMVDVDGICGGYNLQFAFSSAYCAYQELIKKLGE